MKVLYVNHSASLDGGTHALMSLIESLHAGGEVDPLVLLPCPGPIANRLDRAGIAYRIIDIGHSNWDVYHVPLLRMVLQAEQIDIVHANTLESYPAVVAARICEIPVVWHIHEMIDHIEYYSHSFAYVDDAMFADLVSAASRICTVSNASRKAFTEYCRGRAIDLGDKIQVIHNGITAPEPTESHRHREPRKITGIGNMVSVKGWTYLIEAYAELSKEYEDIELRIVGKVFPGYFPELYGAAEKCGVADRVKFLTETENINTVYDESDIIVCSSVIETFPMVILEAMAHAKPIVATNVGGIGELIDDRQTGVLVPPRDSSALATGIKHYLADWSAACDMGRRAHERAAAEFSLAGQAEKFRMLYQALMQEMPHKVLERMDRKALEEMLFEHMLKESEKLSRLEQRFDEALMEHRLQLVRHLESSLNQHREDLTTLENVVKNLVNKWPFRLMRKLKNLFGGR